MFTPKYPAPSYAHYLVAVDLGKTKVGVSVWWVPGGQVQLVAAETLTSPRGSPPEEVARHVHHAAHTAIEGHTSEHAPGVFWVCEWPMKYPDKRKYHEDIDSLLAVGAALTVAHGPWDAKYRPGKWKGNVPKPAHHRRLRKSLANYLEGWGIPKEDHDTWDAIGIGAFAIGLTKRGGGV